MSDTGPMKELPHPAEVEHLPIADNLQCRCPSESRVAAPHPAAEAVKVAAKDKAQSAVYAEIKGQARAEITTDQADVPAFHLDQV